MTREEAINHIKYGIIENNYPLPKELGKEALDMAIKALEHESSYNSVNSLAESKLKNPKAKTFDVLHFVADNAGLSTFEAIEKAYNMGVSEQEPCDDTVSRQAVITVIKDWWEKGVIAIDDIRELPSVTPTRKKGKWVTKFHGFPPEPYTACSNCDYDIDFGISKLVKADAFAIEPYRPNYCPNCGAEMERS